MKVIYRFVVLLVAASVMFSFADPAAFGTDEGKAVTLSSDPRLNPAKESFERGEHFMEKGNIEFRRRPGLAQKMFEHAEDYYAKASFMYREEGEKLGIDTSHEVAECERMNRKAHVWVNKSRRQRKRTGAGI